MTSRSHSRGGGDRHRDRSRSRDSGRAHGRSEDREHSRGHGYDRDCNRGRDGDRARHHSRDRGHGDRRHPTAPASDRPDIKEESGSMRGALEGRARYEDGPHTRVKREADAWDGSPRVVKHEPGQPRDAGRRVKEEEPGQGGGGRRYRDDEGERERYGRGGTDLDRDRDSGRERKRQEGRGQAGAEEREREAGRDRNHACDWDKDGGRHRGDDGGGGRGGGGQRGHGHERHGGGRDRRREDDREHGQHGREDGGGGGDGGPEMPAPPKEQPNLGLSGKLAEETNKTETGVILKHQPPPDAAKPDKKWRLYVFKDGKMQDDPLYLHRKDHHLFGRDVSIADMLCAHPSISKQHAVVQFRRTTKTDALGLPQTAVRPYIMDLGTTNGTFLNGERIEGERFYELLLKDTIKFGMSSREYLLLHEGAKDE